MILFEVDFTVKTGNLEFKDSMLVPAKDKKAAKTVLLQLTSKAAGVKGLHSSGRHILYDMSQSTLEITKVTPYAS